VIGDAGSESDDALMGKVSYMAPEVPVGGGVTPACDVWGLGITLHQIATGRRPFDAANHAATILRITGEQIDLAALRLESELRELITAMLDKDPAARPSALEVSVALERLAAPDTDVARWVAQLPAPPR
jgi:serine/threonine protein kinase